MAVYDTVVSLTPGGWPLAVGSVEKLWHLAKMVAGGIVCAALHARPHFLW